MPIMEAALLSRAAEDRMVQTLSLTQNTGSAVVMSDENQAARLADL